MKWLARIGVAAVALGAGGVGLSLALEAPAGDPEVVELLSGMTFVPDQGSLDSVLGEAAIGELISIAEKGSDPGLRLRAYGALGEYDGNADEFAATQALRRAVTKFAPFERGTELLYLRASIRSLALLDGAEAVPDLVPLLGHAMRDVRATAAQALGSTKSESAILPLRQRAQVEEEEQVLLAIEDALFELADSE